jgi:hypothetical protein
MKDQIKTCQCWPVGEDDVKHPLIAYVWKSGEVTLEHPSTLIPVQHFLMNLTNDEPVTREPMLLTVLQAAEINHDLHCHQHSDFGWLKVGQA